MAMLFVNSKLVNTISYNGGTINIYENGEIHGRWAYDPWRKFNTISGAKGYITKQHNLNTKFNWSTQ